VRVDQKVLSNTWWPVATHAEGTDQEIWEKVLSLWFNSTPGILSLIGARVDTRGPWIELKKPILEEIAVLDPRELSKKAQGQLCRAYDEVSKLQIQPLACVATDAVHKRIDAALAKTFEIDDDLARLRDMLAREPIVSMRLPKEASKDSEVAVS